jgi:hypothetical protein
MNCKIIFYAIKILLYAYFLKYNDSNLKTEEKVEVNMLITSRKILDASNIGIKSWYDFCSVVRLSSSATNNCTVITLFSNKILYFYCKEEIQRKCVHMRKYAFNKIFIACFLPFLFL